MAGSFSNYLELEILDHVFGAASYTPAATHYFALSTADPTEDGSGIAEPSGNNYARAAFVNNKTNWGDAAAGAITNDVAVTFNTASGSWGTIAHFAVFDALTGGNMLIYGSLSVSKAIGTGDTPKFNIGDVDITLT